MKENNERKEKFMRETENVIEGERGEGRLEGEGEGRD